MTMDRDERSHKNIIPNSTSGKQTMPIAVASFLLLVFAILGFYVSTEKKNTRAEVVDSICRSAQIYAMEAFGNIDRMQEAIRLNAMQISPAAKAGDRQQMGELLQQLCRSTGAYMSLCVDRDGAGVDQDGQSVAIETQQGETTLTADGFYYVYDETEDKVSLVVTVETEQRHTSVLAYFRPQDLMKYGDIHDYDGSVWSAVVAPDGKTLFMRSFRNLNYGSNLLETMKKSLDEKQRNRLSNDIRYGKINSCQTTLGNVQTLVVLTPMGINNWYFAMGISADYVDKMLAVEMRAAKRMIAAIILLASSFGIFVIAYYYINRNTFQSTRADLQNKADTDLLTELNNKMATERKIKEYIEDFTGVQGLLFIFDIDNFKKINDTRGHAFGDEVLREIGMRLRTEFRSSDIMGRVGGDEFILFLKNIQNEDIIRKEAGRMAHIFRDLCVGQYTKYSVTASIGCALYPGDADNFEDLYKAADKGLYSAKHRGKNQLVFYRDIRGDV